MSIFRSIVFSAALAGVITGADITGAQMVGTIPLIQKSEVYERKAEAPAAVAPTAAAQPAHTHDHGAAAHSHEAEWEPTEGLQRNAFTTGANILTAIGFA